MLKFKYKLPRRRNDGGNRTHSIALEDNIECSETPIVRSSEQEFMIANTNVPSVEYSDVVQSY